MKFLHELVPQDELVARLETLVADGWEILSVQRRSDLPTHVRAPFDVIALRRSQ